MKPKFPGRALSSLKKTSLRASYLVLLGILLSGCGRIGLGPPRSPDLDPSASLILDITESLEFLQPRREKMLRLVVAAHGQGKVGDSFYNRVRLAGLVWQAAEGELIDQLDTFQAYYFSSPDPRNDPELSAQRRELLVKRSALSAAIRALEALLLEQNL